MSGFPCNINGDSNSTILNPFSWNNNVNMLYIDQPVGTGFSYSILQNGTLDLLTTTSSGGPLFTPLDGEPLPETNATFLAATLDPRSSETTQNTTIQAARTLWQFAQVWFQEYVLNLRHSTLEEVVLTQFRFPEYDTENKQISLWGTSVRVMQSHKFEKSMSDGLNVVWRFLGNRVFLLRCRSK